MSGSEQIVTEIIVDATAAEEGLVRYKTALIGAGEATDEFGNKVEFQAGSYGRAARATDAYIAKLDPVFAASQRIGKETDTVAAAIRGLEQQLIHGAVSTDQYNARQATLAGRMGEVKAIAAELTAGTITAQAAMARMSVEAEKAGHAHSVLGLSASESTFVMRTFSREAIGAFSAVASGAPVLAVLADRFTQLTYEMTLSRHGFSLMKEAFGGAISALLSPMGLLTTGLVAIAAAFTLIVYNAETAERKLNSVKNALLPTRADYESLSESVIQVGKNLAATSDVTVDEGTKIVKALASVSNFSGNAGALQRMGAEVALLAKTMGDDIPKATEKWVAAMQDPAKAAEEWAKTNSYGFNDSLARQIKLLQDGADKAGAFGLVEQTLNSNLKKVEENGTKIEEAWKKLGETFVHVGKDGGSLATSLQSLVVGAINLMDGFLKRLQELREFFGTIPGWVVKLATSTTAPWSKEGLTQNPALGGADPSIQGALSRAAEVNNLNLDLLTRLQKAEGVLNPDGTWQTSSAGARSSMQIKPKTFAGIQSQPGVFPTAVGFGDIDNPEHSVMNGAALFAQLLTKYKKYGPGVAVLAWVDGEPAIDKIIASGEGTPSQEAQNQVERVLGPNSNRFTGSGFANEAITANKAPGLDNRNAAAEIEKEALASGTLLAVQKQLAIEETNLIIKMTALKDAGMGNSEAYKILDQQLHGVWGRMNENISAADKLVRTRQEDAEIAGKDGAANQTLAAAFLEIQRAADASGDSTQVALQQQLAYTAITAGYSKELANSTLQSARQVVATEQLAAAQGKGQEAIDNVTASTQGHIEALKLDGHGMEENNATALTLIESKKAIAASNRNLTASQDIAGYAKENEMIQLQTSLIGASTKQINAEVAALRERQKLGLVAGQQANAQQQASIASARYTANLQSDFQQQQQDANELANAFTQSFDTISQAMVDAFLTGNAEAVNWGNVMKSVLQQVIAEFLKLALLNPLLNSLFGGNYRSELGGVIGAIGAGSGAGGGGGGSSGLMNNGLTVLGVGNQLTGGGITNTLGNAGIFQPGGFFGSGGAISSTLATPVFGGSAAAEALAAGGPLSTAGMGVQFGPVTSGLASGGAGLPLGAAAGTIGQFAGGIGGGFALGSLAGGALQSSLNKTGPAPQIGAGAGAVAGALAGTLIFPGIGTIIGGLLGGIIGGLGGGTIGPRPASQFSSIPLSIGPGGQLVQGSTVSQNADANPLRVNTTANRDWLNAVMAAHGISLGALGGVGQLGTNTPDGFQNPNKFADFATAFPNFRFGSQDQGLNNALKDRSFSGIQQLSDITVAVQQFQAVLASTDAADKIAGFLDTLQGVATADIPAKLQDIVTFVTQTVPELLASGEQIGSYSQALTAVAVKFDPAIAKAHELGYKEAELTAARDQATASVIAATAAQQKSLDQSIADRYTAAHVAVTGDTAYGVKAQEDAFYANAQSQRDQFSAQLIGIYGPAFKDTQDYANEMAFLDRTIGEERLALIKKLDGEMLASTQSTAGAAAAALAAVAAAAKRLHDQFQADASIAQRFDAAYVSVTGDKRYSDAAALRNFDNQAKLERENYKQQLIDLYGDSIVATQDFNNEMAYLDRTLAEERLAIQEDFNRQARADAISAVTSLADYALNLQRGPASPLSPQAQYDTAKSQFNAVSGAAAAGDFGSIQKLQSFSDAFLNASRGVYGSGAGYAEDFQRVLNTLNSVGSIAPDTLTASAYAFEMQSQTKQLVDSQSDLKKVLDRILAELQQGKGAPARLAA